MDIGCAQFLPLLKLRCEACASEPVGLLGRQWSRFQKRMPQVAAKFKEAYMVSSAGQLRTMARSKLKGKWRVALIVSFIFMTIGGLSGGITYNLSDLITPDAGYYINEIATQFARGMEMTWLFLPVVIIVLGAMAVVALTGLFIQAVVNLCHTQFYINLARGQDTGFSLSFSKPPAAFKAFILGLVTGLFVFLWMLLLIVPGIIAAYRYAMAMYILAENPDIGVMEALRESKRLMAGRKMKLFLLHLSFIGWGLLSLLTFGIGLLFLIPYISAAEATFFLEASDQQAVSKNE